MTWRDMPTLNAALNATSAVLLVCGYVAIRAGRREGHRRFMAAAFGLSVLFLACYLTYHSLSGIQTRFPETSWFRPYYLVLLGTHTVLAMVVVPMVLRTVFLAWKGRFEEHRRLARWTFPIWLYVSVTGVLVYLFLYHVFKGG